MASVLQPKGSPARVVAWLRAYWRLHLRRFASFAVVGIISTMAFVALYAATRPFVAPLVANFVALSLTMLFNFTANRNYTFRARDRGWAVQGARYLVAYVVGMGASSVVLYLSLKAASGPQRTIETMIAAASGGVATVIRFVLLAVWVFRPRSR